ncbi:patatin-like phospholipase family protein [Lutibacter sp. TH_r2]|uniref:patatin-like phospholipase family protein n=1 Tax=Lutibacter sp. TH_r2 TaxID=3082083 RepID=UPI002952DA7C|nr:patatin-like phospholipase family protein [Lutibacter sp. TH_r2]MDV7186282.1 patatin-like phospholipase family protein [Lutibacter sp. TH_r2]
MKKVILITLLFFVSTLFAQEKPVKDLKVGVVLSGGGAKGFSHVAVLKVLEEAGVRVDYIGGTSMGAIVGGLYASGYNATELDSIIKTIDFFKVISNDLPRKSKPFYEKESGEKYALTLPVKNRKVGIPRAITDGQNVLNLITKLTQHVNNINDFNKLPIPFLCIGTDLETGKQKIFREGFLPEVVKASGSFPTLLSPVEIDGKLYSDGGIVNNFPVDEVKAMGADIIIGVDIQGGLDTKDKLISAPKILNQIVGFQMYKSIEEKRNRTDILIRPDLTKYNVVSFEAIDDIMKIGDSTSRVFMEQLKAISNLQQKKEKKVIDFSKSEKFHIKSIEIQGNKNYTRAYVLGKLNLKKSDTTSYKSLVTSINNLYGTGNFESIQYKIVDEEKGSVVKFKVREHLISNYFQIGVHYDELYKTGVLINGLSKHLLFKNDVISTDLILGDNIRYNLNYFIDNGFYTSFGIKSRYNSFNSNVNFDEDNINKINLEYQDFTNQIYVQTVFNRKFAIGAGFEHKRIKAYTETISTVENNPLAEENGRFYFDKSDYLSGIAYIKIDTYDKSYFQKKGAYLDAKFTWYLTSSDYNNNFKPFSQLKGKFGYAHTFFNNLTAHFTSEAGITMGTNTNQVLDFIVGGYGDNYINNFTPLFGYDFGELREDSFLKSALTLRYEFLPKNYFSAAVNYARVENDIFNEGMIFDNTKSGYMLGYGLDTFLGPIEVNYAWSPDQKNSNWYFNVGYWF